MIPRLEPELLKQTNLNIHLCLSLLRIQHQKNLNKHTVQQAITVHSSPLVIQIV